MGCIYDITYCNNDDCMNLECERHYTHAPLDRDIWVSDNKDCEYWREK